nr:MAG TPA: Na+ dependent nucleoside transporter [Caudoviricetes sp.]
MSVSGFTIFYFIIWLISNDAKQLDYKICSLYNVK